ncbi:ubiquinol oxidase subunit II [Buchnera aphidicola]|uniref:Ubiquinol oxidase subunit 2 n=1 Tax=Buchnera aphidicola (Aphis aurantii) TaxID=1470492 RepID=A0AAU6W604_9GAMM
MIYSNFNKFFKILLLTSIIFILNGCDSMLLNSHGIVAQQESSLILISFIMMLFIVIPVFFMTIYFSIKYRASNITEIYKPNWSESKTIETIIWIIPILIISFLAYLTWNYSHLLDPKKSILSKYKPIKIDVIALDWRWLFIYPDYGVATINEIAFPKNTPVVFRITSNSVMNSFFIPSLGSQIYAMPGMITKLNLISNDLGKYKGISSNYSGRGFSNMKFTVISLPNKKIFIDWIDKIQHSPKKLNTLKKFNKVSFPNENHYVEYFSNVEKTLFDRIVH